MVFNLIVDNFIKRFVYSDNAVFQKDAFVNEQEIKIILDYCKSDSLEIDQLIRNVWVYF